MMASFMKIIRSMFGGNSSPADEEIAAANFSNVSRDDPRLAAAMEQARATVDQFIAMLNDPPPNSDFNIKKRFEDGDRSENMWVSQVQIEGDEFVGIIGNDPQILTHLKYGEPVRVRTDEITDWMVTAGDEMHGGFSVRQG